MSLNGKHPKLLSLLNAANGCIQKRNRSLSAQWTLMEYANQLQELTENSVNGCASRCWWIYPTNLATLGAFSGFNSWVSA